jgi:putative ABC transport system permease protein
MRLWRELAFLLNRLIHRRRAERELDEEIAVHRDLEIEQNIASGMTPEEARYAATRAFGSAALSKELCRNIWGLSWLETIWQDLRYAGRMWSRNPGFTLFAVFGLALAIGANTAVFTIVNALLYRDLSFPGSERIAYLSSIKIARGNGDPLEVISYADYRDFKERLKSFEDLAAVQYIFQGVNLSDDSDFPERHRAIRMTANTLSVVGQKLVLGRDLEPSDTQPGASPVVLLSHRLWESRYNKDKSLIGKTVRIDEIPVTVIGVTAPEIHLWKDYSLWLPLQLPSITPQEQTARGQRDLFIYGRLANGVSIRQAGSEAGAVARQLVIEYPATNQDIGAEVIDLNDYRVNANARLVCQALLGAVAFVLLIACANIANLLLGRAVIRSREMSIRAALGAGRARIIRQLLTESILLSVIAGALGSFLAYFGVRAFDVALDAMEVRESGSQLVFSIDRNVLLYMAAISLGTGIVFGLVPALRISRIDLSSGLKEGGQGAGVGVRRRLLSSILVGGEVALSVVLLMGAGLMIRSIVSAGNMNLGVNTANVLTMRIDLPQAKYKLPQDRASFYQKLAARIEALPGVETVTIASALPGNGPFLREGTNAFQIEGAPIADKSGWPRTAVLNIGPGYFRAMQGRLLLGREFTELDGDAGHETVIINQSLAARHWPGENPLGKRISLDNQGTEVWSTIVGVVADIIQYDDNNVLPRVYLPHRQNPDRSMFIAARTRIAPASLATAFRESVRDLDENLPVFELRSLDDHVLRGHAATRLIGYVFIILAIIALALASIGLYAVISQLVNQRTREMAIRAAMGASESRLWRFMFLQGMRPFVIGLALGSAMSFALGGVLHSLLIGVSSRDPVTYLLVVTVLAVVASLACGLPARRAARSDPAAALRFE